MTEPGGEQSTSPWMRPAWLVSAGLLALIVVGAFGVLVVMPMLKPAAPTTTAPVSAPTQAPSPAAPLDSGVCPPLAAGPETKNLAAGPADTVWASLYGALAPQSKAAGPFVVDASGMRRCYSHDAAGALLARANFDAQLYGPPAVRTALAGYMTTKATRQVVVTQIKPTFTLPPNYEMPTVAGFSVSYAGDEATVELVYRVQGGALNVSRRTMVWEDNDWRIKTAADGQVPDPQPVYSLTNYVKWPG